MAPRVAPAGPDGYPERPGTRRPPPGVPSGPPRPDQLGSLGLPPEPPPAPRRPPVNRPAAGSSVGQVIGAAPRRPGELRVSSGVPVTALAHTELSPLLVPPDVEPNRRGRKGKPDRPDDEREQPVAEPEELDDVPESARRFKLPGWRADSGRAHRYRDSDPEERPSTARTATKGKKPKRGRRRRSTFWRELPMLVVVALLLTFLIQTFLARVYEIPSGSMEKTLHGCSGCNNDRVLVDKLSYRFGKPSPGDVVVFVGPPNWAEDEPPTSRSDNPILRGLQNGLSLIGLAPPDEADFIKRVIAVGGQTVACCDAQNRVTVDGKPLNEPYIYYLPDAGPPRQATFGPVLVPEGQLWMMGDSRNNSADSRFPGHFGPIPVADVIGKARFVVLPLSRIKLVPDGNPQMVSLSAPAGGSTPVGAPLALGVLGTAPLAAGRRWQRRRGHWQRRRGRRDRVGPAG